MDTEIQDLHEDIHVDVQGNSTFNPELRTDHNSSLYQVHLKANLP